MPNKHFYFFFYSFNSALRLVDVSTDSNKFQELLLERTKALAAQTEALKSSSHSDGKLKRFSVIFSRYSPFFFASFVDSSGRQLG